MKKNYNLTIIILMILFSAFQLNAQVLIEESFTYTLPAYIGGNGDAGSSSNTWTTHSVTAGQTTTIDLIAGNLSYTGLAAPTGNKLYLFSNANATSRDVNKPFTTSSTTGYYSALINVVDNSQISGTNFDYFMCFGASAGTSVTILGGRLGIKSTNSGANFRLAIGNTSGGTLTYTDSGQDLNFGTTYLVVVKYDISAAPTVASLWVNPTSLGGTEPAGSVTCNTGSGTFAALSSICLRNSSTTPKVEIDEIRVGTTWAQVTPTGVGINKLFNKNNIQLSPNPSNGKFDILIANDSKSIYELSIFNAMGAVVYNQNNVNTNVAVDLSNLNKGVYFVQLKNNNSFASKKIVIQ